MLYIEKVSFKCLSFNILTMSINNSPHNSKIEIHMKYEKSLISQASDFSARGLWGSLFAYHSPQSTSVSVLDSHSSSCTGRDLKYKLSGSQERSYTCGCLLAYTLNIVEAVHWITIRRNMEMRLSMIQKCTQKTK